MAAVGYSFQYKALYTSHRGKTVVGRTESVFTCWLLATVEVCSVSGLVEHCVPKLQTEFNIERWPMLPSRRPQLCYINASFRSCLVISLLLPLYMWHCFVLFLLLESHKYLFHDGSWHLSSSVGDSPDVWLNIVCVNNLADMRFAL